jgi:glycosyltransferase involved in cell wall biosynthesis
MDQVEGELKDGILTNPNDAEELKTKILRLLNPLRWQLLSIKARQAAEKYTWRAYLDRIETSLYEACTQSAPVALPAKVNLARLSHS